MTRGFHFQTRPPFKIEKCRLTDVTGPRRAGANAHFAEAARIPVMSPVPRLDLPPFSVGDGRADTYAGDIAGGNLDTITWGCIGYHYSSNWYDGSSSSGAIWYINAVKKEFANKTWRTRWPSVNWPS